MHSWGEKNSRTAFNPDQGPAGLDKYIEKNSLRQREMKVGPFFLVHRLYDPMHPFNSLLVGVVPSGIGRTSIIFRSLSGCTGRKFPHNGPCFPCSVCLHLVN